jgi:17beta-estradiol 17-dehydrogenase / very-long-chain 3-oxoacyl-CoA reductase
MAESSLFDWGVYSFAAIGAGFLSLKVSRTFRLFWRPPANLPAIYGKNSWAVITGATDGIGKGFAMSLARRGFNIALVSRNPDKLSAVAKELSSLHSVETRTIVAAFDSASSPSFYKKLVKQVEDLDVSILVNNVGVYHLGDFVEMSIEEALRMVTINTFPQTHLTHQLLPRLLARSSRSAVIDLSSNASWQLGPQNAVYSATKAYNRFLTQGLAYEYSDKVDFLSVCPSLTSTPMTNSFATSSLAASVQEVVEGALLDLGKKTVTVGATKHIVLTYPLRSLHQSLREQLIEYFRVKQLKGKS